MCRSAAAKCDSGANFASSTAPMAAQLFVKPAPHGLQSARSFKKSFSCNGEFQQLQMSKERDLSRWLPKRCTFFTAAMAFSSYTRFHTSIDRLTRDQTTTVSWNMLARGQFQVAWYAA